MNTKLMILGGGLALGMSGITGLSCGYVLGITHPPVVARFVPNNDYGSGVPLTAMASGSVAARDTDALAAALATRAAAAVAKQEKEAGEGGETKQPVANLAGDSQPVGSDTNKPVVDPFTTPAIAQKIMVQIARLHGVVRPDKSGVAPDVTKMITVFFDPRCPYCHQLFEAIDGKVPVRWIPVPVLQPTHVGVKSSFFILDAKGDAGKAIQEAFSYVGEGSVAHTPEEAQKWVDAVPVHEEEKHWLQDSLMSFVALHKSRNGNIGVPSIIVPHADGTISMHDGYEPGDESKIIAEYQQGR